jgi:hypothetical protein
MSETRKLTVSILNIDNDNMWVALMTTDNIRMC